MRNADSNGLTIYTQRFGLPTHPALLLIMGAGCSMLWWDEAFCKTLAEEGFFVIRYDHRDTGLSTCYPVGEPGYSFADLADDAIRVLDKYSISKAILMGMSMGGMLAQIAAVRHPKRVAGLVLLSSMYFGPGAEQLPASSEEVNAIFAESLPDLDSEPHVWVNRLVRQWRICAQSQRPFNEAYYANMAWADVTRAGCFACSTNHAHVQGGLEDLTGVSALQIPMLAIHGTEDVVIPYVHGQMLSSSIPGAELLTLEGAGHELHPLDRTLVIQAIKGKFGKEKPVAP